MSERCTKCSAILSDIDNKTLIEEFSDDLDECIEYCFHSVVDIKRKKWERRKDI